jgi:hypothetical protein
MDAQRCIEPLVNVIWIALAKGIGEMSGGAAGHDRVEEGKKHNQGTDHIEQAEVSCAQSLKNPSAAEKGQPNGQDGTGVACGGVEGYAGG